jgi:hypothetical protein
MAKRRMFSADVVCTDDFLSLPATSQAIYLQLGMSADDDGFVANPKTIARSFYNGVKHMHTLTERGYLIPFDSGVIVITHWKLANNVPKDRYNPTKFADELSKLISSKDVYQRKN